MELPLRWGWISQRPKTASKQSCSVKSLADCKHTSDEEGSLRGLTYCWKPIEILNNGLKVAEASTVFTDLQVWAQEPSVPSGAITAVTNG